MNLFKQSIPVQALVIMLAMTALWYGAIASPLPMPTPQGGDVLYGVLYSWLNKTPLLAVIIAMLLVLFGGVLLNILLVDLNLSAQNSLLPTLLYAICMSSTATTLTPMTIVSLLMIACLHQLAIRGSLLTIPPERACATTALIGICSMFYLPAALLIISYMIVAINYRLYSWRDWAVMLLGFAAPYVLLATVLMFTNGLAGWWQNITEVFSNIHLITTKTPLLKATGCIVLVLALIAGIIAVFNRSGESTVLWQKNAITQLSMLLGGLAILAITRLFPIDLQLFALPFTFCVGILLMPTQRSNTFGQRKRREWVYALILVLIFIAAIVC